MGEIYGHDKLIISADLRDEFILTNAWQNQTELKMKTFFENFANKGFRRFCCTDVSRDGMLAGVDTNLYKKIKKLFPDVQLIASGGVSSVSDIEELERAGCAGAIIGKAIYEGRISLEQLKTLTQDVAN
jgi:phosphoribosylformimino-5-aminoimidazole carboxamide ribotide isomerase